MILPPLIQRLLTFPHFAWEIKAEQETERASAGYYPFMQTTNHIWTWEKEHGERERGPVLTKQMQSAA